MAKSRKMKAYDSYDLWVEDQPAKHRKIIGALRKLVKKTAPRLEEVVKWGNGCHAAPEGPIIYLYAGAKDHVQLGFFIGAKVKDPKGLLEGSGQYVRHVKVRTPADIDARYFASLIRSAVKIGR